MKWFKGFAITANVFFAGVLGGGIAWWLGAISLVLVLALLAE